MCAARPGASSARVRASQHVSQAEIVRVDCWGQVFFVEVFPTVMDGHRRPALGLSFSQFQSPCKEERRCCCLARSGSPSLATPNVAHGPHDSSRYHGRAHRGRSTGAWRGLLAATPAQRDPCCARPTVDESTAGREERVGEQTNSILRAVRKAQSGHPAPPPLRRWQGTAAGGGEFSWPSGLIRRRGTEAGAVEEMRVAILAFRLIFGRCLVSGRISACAAAFPYFGEREVCLREGPESDSFRVAVILIVA
ncbi:unnamed protein product [Lampetra planeri]